MQKENKKLLLCDGKLKPQNICLFYHRWGIVNKPNRNLKTLLIKSITENHCILVKKPILIFLNDTNVNWMKSCKSIKTKCKNKFTDKMFCTKHKSQSFTLINTIIFFIEYYQNLFRYQPNMIKTSHSRNILETRNTGKRTKPKFCFSWIILKKDQTLSNEFGR